MSHERASLVNDRDPKGGEGVRDSAALLRDGYFKGLWPKGAPIEAWAEVCIDPAVRLLSKYVLDLEARLDLADREANDLMTVAYQQGKAEAVEITSNEARARFPGLERGFDPGDAVVAK